MYLDHLRESDNGNLEPLNDCGRYTCEHIRLNRLDLLNWRRLKRQIADDLTRWEDSRMRLEQLLSLTTDPAEKTKILDGIAAIESAVLRSREQFGL